MAQRIVSVENSTDFLSRIAREGYNIEGTQNALGLNYPYPSAPYTNANITGTFVPKQGKCYWIDNFVLSAYTDAPSGMVSVQVLIGEASDTALNAVLPRTGQKIFMKSGTTITVPFHGFVQEFHRIMIFTFPVVDVADETKKVWASVSAHGMELTNDLNFNADKTILALGDSTMYGQGVTKGEYMFPFRMRDYYNFTKGENVRLVNKGLGGMTSSDFVNMQKRGFFEVDYVDTILWSFGINDVANGLTLDQQATFRANVKRAIAWKRSRHRTAKMILLGATPVQDTDRHDNLEVLRAIMQEEAELAGEGFFYKNLGDSFDRLDPDKYVEGEGASLAAVHPGDDGNGDIASNLLTYLDSINYKI